MHISRYDNLDVFFSIIMSNHTSISRYEIASNTQTSKFSRKLLSASKRMHSRLSAQFNLSWLIAQCNATSFLTVHRECIARARQACSFQPLLHIEDTQSHIITHRAHQPRTMQSGCTLPHRIAAAVFELMISMGGESRHLSRAKCSNHRGNVAVFFTLP